MAHLELLRYLESYLTPQRKARFDAVLSQRTKHFTVAIEDVYKLHNTSAVIRSCDVFGVQEVNIIEERNRKRIDREIAMGAQKWVDVNRFNSVGDCIAAVKDQGYQIVATTPHEQDQVLSEFDVSKKSCFFFGRESEGLSDEVMAAADCFLKIPMVGFTESLNISVSAAIILQDVTYRLRKENIDWPLTPTELMDKRLDWISKSLKSYELLLQRFYERQKKV